MEHNSIRHRIVINATSSKVWETLTDPAKIVLYLGSQTQTDWKPGSAITWEGEMQGVKFQNKGVVLENIPNKLLRFSYWSGMGGDKDLPENYSEIAYTLKLLDDNLLELTYSRIKIPTAIEKQVFEGHLPFLLEEIKKLSESD